MKAIVFDAFGPPEVLRLEEVPTPAGWKSGSREIEVAGTNPILSDFVYEIVLSTGRGFSDI